MFRSGIQSIDSGQYEASRALGIGPLQRLRVIIIPQALRNIFPALGNYALVLVKDSTLVAVISVPELMRSGEMPAAATFQALLVYRSEEHTSELQSLMGSYYAVFCMKKKNIQYKRQ